MPLEYLSPNPLIPRATIETPTEQHLWRTAKTLERSPFGQLVAALRHPKELQPVLNELRFSHDEYDLQENHPSLSQMVREATVRAATVADHYKNPSVESKLIVGMLQAFDRITGEIPKEAEDLAKLYGIQMKVEVKPIEADNGKAAEILTQGKSWARNPVNDRWELRYMPGISLVHLSLWGPPDLMLRVDNELIFQTLITPDSTSAAETILNYAYRQKIAGVNSKT